MAMQGCNHDAQFFSRKTHGQTLAAGDRICPKFTGQEALERRPRGLYFYGKDWAQDPWPLYKKSPYSWIGVRPEASWSIPVKVDKVLMMGNQWGSSFVNLKNMIPLNVFGRGQEVFVSLNSEDLVNPG